MSDVAMVVAVSAAVSAIAIVGFIANTIEVYVRAKYGQKNEERPRPNYGGVEQTVWKIKEEKGTKPK